MSQNPNNENQRNPDDNRSWLATGAAIVGGVAAVAGGLYLLGSKDKPQRETPKTEPQTNKPGSKQSRPAPKPAQTSANSSSSGTMAGLINILGSLTSQTPTSNYLYTTGKVARNAPPSNPTITNLNSLLADIHVRHIQLKDDDFRLHYNVFDKLFQHLHERMADVDLYYRKYSSTRQFAGSHYDNLRIKKPDEFDMDIVIKLPLNISESGSRDQSDIVIEPQAAGFVHLKMGVQFQKLPYRDGAEWMVNKTAYEWMDNRNYLLRSKFLAWWKAVVNKALNTFQHRNNMPVFYVDGVEYTIGKSESGPAMTLFLKNQQRGFKLDVDLVPALKFPETRWPISTYYRQIPRGCCKNTWMVVGKPNKDAPEYEQERSWRIALHNQERELMHNSYHLRQAVRLIKKLRDEQGLNKIASYYIKTLFFWEIVEQNSEAFWRNNPAFLFKHMVKILHAALVKGNIPYFWNKRNNLIGKVDSNTLSQYAAKLVPLIKILDNPSGENYKLVAKYLLSKEEFKVYNEKFLRIAKL